MRSATLFLALVLAAACSSDSSSLPDAVPDAGILDAAFPDAVVSDAFSDVCGDLCGNIPADDLPNALPFSFQREDPGTGAPLSPEEVDAFSRRMRAFFEEMAYFDWLLRMSHGIDESTGMRDFRLWWTDTFALKEDGNVSIVHRWYEEHGGHNILKWNSTILANALGAYLATGAPELAELSEQYCKGMSSTMLGMVHNADDEILHLMARNVVMSNHSYTTHDGRQKSVDYANWFHPYDRWNCSRFLYEDNPYWGQVWVTNTRSKDGLGYVLWAWVPVLYASTRAEDPDVREACTETKELLKLFAKDVVDNDYHIRSKDAEGRPYTPGVDEAPPEADTGDLASFVTWDPLFPDAECNNKLAASLLAYGDPRDLACTPLGGDPYYEVLSMRNNTPNGAIMRAFHIAAIQLAIVRGNYDIAQASLAGLEERFIRDTETDLTEITSNEKSWFRSIDMSRFRAAGVGYPLSPDEVRRIHGFLDRSDQAFREFSTWDIWDERVPDGEHKWRPPIYEEDEEGERTYWADVETMGLLYHWCWSPFRNPAGTPLVNCDILLGR